MADDIQYVAKVSGSFGGWTAQLIASFQGWIGGYWVQFLPKGTIPGTLIILWCVDLFTGTALALRVTYWDEATKGPKPKYLRNVRPFSFSLWPKSVIKLVLWLMLATTCSTLRVQLSTLNPLFIAMVGVAIGLVEYSLVTFEFGSILRNTAFFTDNRVLLQVSRFWDRTAQRVIDKVAPEEGENVCSEDSQRVS